MTWETMTGPTPIRHAASVILCRKSHEGPEVLMGQRGKSAAFMPSKFVFPGGRIESGDGRFAKLELLDQICRERLTLGPLSDSPDPAHILGAALRELHEETGLALPADAQTHIRFVFRAITPPGMTRRYDTRFFLLQGDWLDASGDDFGQTDHELNNLHWIKASEAPKLDLPFITHVVLAETQRHLDPLQSRDRGVPFFNAEDYLSRVQWLR